MPKSPTPIPAPPVKIQRGAPSRAPAKKRRRKKKRNPFLWFLQGLVRRIWEQNDFLAHMFIWHCVVSF